MANDFRVNLIDDFDKAIRPVVVNGPRIIREFGLRLERDWKLRVHVVTGEFRDSIRFEMINNDEGVLYSDAPQSVYEEFGVKGRAAHPSLTPLIQENQNAFFESFTSLFS